MYNTTPYMVFSVTYFLELLYCYNFLLLVLVLTHKDQI